MKNILHISDIHLSARLTIGNSRSKCEKLVNELIKDIKANFNELPIDSLFITGDLAYSGLPEEYRDFQSSFLDPLVAALGIDEGQYFFAREITI